MIKMRRLGAPGREAPITVAKRIDDKIIRTNYRTRMGI